MEGSVLWDVPVSTRTMSFVSALSVWSPRCGPIIERVCRDDGGGEDARYRVHEDDPDVDSLGVRSIAGDRASVDPAAPTEIKELKRENAELRRANEILKAASTFFAAELDRPHLR